MSRLTSLESLSPPAVVCGCHIVEVFDAAQSYRAVMEGGRAVILKRLPEDCIQGGRLHPAVRQRLARVREVAEPSVANLLSVERENGQAWLIWEWVEGVSLRRWLDSDPDPSVLWCAMRDLVSSVQSLHVRGLVHGAIHAGNVIIDLSGRVRLTHLSPLLYDDPSADERAVMKLLERCMDRASGSDYALPEAIASMTSEDGFRRLSYLLTDQTRLRPVEGAVRGREAWIRRASLIGALLAAVVGLLLAGGVVMFVRLS